MITENVTFIKIEDIKIAFMVQMVFLIKNSILKFWNLHIENNISYFNVAFHGQKWHFLVKNDIAGVKNDIAGVKNDIAGMKNDIYGQKWHFVIKKMTFRY